MTETDHRDSRQNAHAALHKFAEGFEALPADFLGEGAAFSHGSGRNCALAKFPGRRGCRGRRRWFFHSLRPQGKQENGIITAPTTVLRKRTHPAESRCALYGNVIEMNHIRDEKESLWFVILSLRMRMKTRTEWHSVHFFLFLRIFKKRLHAMTQFMEGIKC